MQDECIDLTLELNRIGEGFDIDDTNRLAVLVGVVSSLLKSTTSSPFAAPLSVPASNPNISDIAAPL